MIIRETYSLCPVCLSRIPASITAEIDEVFLEKHCPAHGTFKTIIWRGGTESFLKWEKNSVTGGGPDVRLTESRAGCPYDCGPCEIHSGGICAVLVEVTNRCNIMCPVCFSNSPGLIVRDPEKRVLENIFIHVAKMFSNRGLPVLQLSGGEPTLRDDLPEIASMARTRGFKLIQLNTNGLRIAEDREYLLNLKRHGVNLIYLQFDGVSDEVYVSLRGIPLMRTKIRVLENCQDIGMPVVLVPTVVSGINDGQIGQIISFAKSWMPLVRGVHFQPVAYFGRFPPFWDEHKRITIPDVIQLIERQTYGEIKSSDFRARKSKDAHCSFVGLFLLRDSRLFSAFKPRLNLIQSKPSETTKRFLHTFWSNPEEVCACKVPSSDLESLGDGFLGYVLKNSLTISGMPFQDVWTIDLERLKGCCIFVATVQGKLVPFCAYYLTSTEGRRLFCS